MVACCLARNCLLAIWADITAKDAKYNVVLGILSCCFCPHCQMQWGLVGDITLCHFGTSCEKVPHTCKATHNV